MLPKEIIPEIKKQLIGQIHSNFPEDKKASALEQINSMNDKQLEEFLIQNNLIQNSEEQNKNELPQKNQQQNCIFCSIISSKIPSYKIAENEKAIAILELNPISYGHTLVVPKEHLSSREEFPDEVLILANEIKEKIKKELKPKDIEVSTQNILGHEIVNILPIYENENINSPRQKADENQLQELQKKLTEKVEEIKSEIKKEKPQEEFKIKQFNAEDIGFKEMIP